jgi:hypothetical protein
MNQSIKNLLDKHREAIDRQWQRRIERYAKRLQQTWELFSDNLDAVPDLDGDVEDLAAVFAVFDELRRLGVRFDPSFLLAIEETRAEVDQSDCDDDYDTSDQFLDCDDLPNDVDLNFSYRLDHPDLPVHKPRTEQTAQEKRIATLKRLARAKHRDKLTPPKAGEV